MTFQILLDDLIFYIPFGGQEGFGNDPEPYGFILFYSELTSSYMDRFRSKSSMFTNFEFKNYISELKKWMLNPQEGGRLDAKRHYVILAKALDGIWSVGHACAVLC